MSERLLIYQKHYDFVVWLYPLINRIPKGHKQVLGKQMEELSISLLLLIVRANKSRSNERVQLQQQFSDELDCLRLLIRLAKDLRFISINQYAVAAEKMNEIGRMLSGWVKSTETKKEVKQETLL